MVRLMTIDARFHFHRQHRDDRVLRPYIAMTGVARHPLGGMLAVAEEHEVRQAIYRRRRQDNLALWHRTMAWHAGLARREACARARQRHCMAACAREIRRL